MIALGFCLSAYLFLCLVAHLWTPYRLFENQDSSYHMDTLSRSFWITLSNGDRLAAAYYPNSQSPYVILFSHGNRADMGLSMRYRDHFLSLGYSFLMYDYPGYGCSEGRPTEQNIKEAALAVYDHACTHFNIDPKHMILYGRSLGGGPSCFLASQRAAGGLILDSTFMSVYRIKTWGWPLFWGDKFNNLAALKKISCPVWVLHGAADHLIPPFHARALHKASQHPTSRLTLIPHAGHHHLLLDYEAFDPSFLSFMSAIQAKTH